MKEVTIKLSKLTDDDVSFNMEQADPYLLPLLDKEVVKEKIGKIPTYMKEKYSRGLYLEINGRTYCLYTLYGEFRIKRVDAEGTGTKPENVKEDLDLFCQTVNYTPYEDIFRELNIEPGTKLQSGEDLIEIISFGQKDIWFENQLTSYGEVFFTVNGEEASNHIIDLLEILRTKNTRVLNITVNDKNKKERVMENLEVKVRVANIGGTSSGNRNWRVAELLTEDDKVIIKSTSILSEVFNLGDVPITSKKTLLNKLNLKEVSKQNIGHIQLGEDVVNVLSWASINIEKPADFIYPQLVEMFATKDEKKSEEKPVEEKKPQSVKKETTPKPKKEEKPFVKSALVDVLEEVKDLNHFRKILFEGQQIQVGEEVVLVVSTKAIPKTSFGKGAKGVQKYWAVVNEELKTMKIDTSGEKWSLTIEELSELPEEKAVVGAKKRFAQHLKQEKK